MIRVFSLLTLLFISIQGFSQVNQSTEKFKALLSILELAYVDSVQHEALTEHAIRETLEELDPHSVYISRDELQQMNEPLVGKFEGIGVQFQILKDTIVVVDAIAGGPSEKLGIQSGDKIVTIEGENVAGVSITNQDVMDKLRGEKGTRVNVGIKRSGAAEILEYTITRDNIPLYTVDAAYMATPDVGYIKVIRFAQNTIDEFRNSLQDLKSKGMESLILDLRGNGGGYLHTAIAMADEFLGNGKMVVYTEGLHQNRQNAYASAKGEFEKGKLVILIDEGSASASEIVAGAVQDWDRGIIIGRRSFGKGLVQKPFNLPDGSAVRLTTARYYTPTGRSIQKPYDEGVEAYNQDLLERSRHGEYLYRDSIIFPDSLKYYTPAKRVVFGGGGIMPDIFIPVDTTGHSDYYVDIFRNNVFNEFTLSYLDKNRAQLLRTYPDLETFKENFTVTDEFFESFVSYAERDGVKRREEQIRQSRQWLEAQLKSTLARNLWDRGAYYEVMNPTNDAYRKALEILKDSTFDNQNIIY